MFFFEGPPGWLTAGTKFKYDINSNPAVIDMAVGSVPLLEKYWSDSNEVEVQGQRYGRLQNNVFIIKVSNNATPVVLPLGLHDLRFDAEDLPPVTLLKRDRAVWTALAGGAVEAVPPEKPKAAADVLAWDTQGLQLLTSDSVSNQQKGCELLRQAANAGYALSQYRLGYCYESGKGVPQSFQTANQWYEKAAGQGNVDAEYKLGHSYRTGRGVAINLPVALGWYKKAAEANDQDALHNVGWMYSTGQGTQKDENEAYKWFLRAAEQGEAGSQLEVASRLRQGTGVAKDLVLAYSWLLVLSAQQDHFQPDDWKQIQNQVLEVGGVLTASDKLRAVAQSHIWMGEIAKNDMTRYGRSD